MDVFPPQIMGPNAPAACLKQDRSLGELLVLLNIGTPRRSRCRRLGGQMWKTLELPKLVRRGKRSNNSEMAVLQPGAAVLVSPPLQRGAVTSRPLSPAPSVRRSRNARSR